MKNASPQAISTTDYADYNNSCMNYISVISFISAGL